MGAYLSASGMQLLTFVCLIMAPSFPLRDFMIPVTFVFGIGFWGVYLKQNAINIGWYEVSFKFVTYALTSVSIAFVYQYLILRAEKQNEENETKLSVME